MASTVCTCLPVSPGDYRNTALPFRSVLECQKWRQGLCTFPEEVVPSSGSSCILSLLPGAAAPAPVNPFQVNQPQPLTLNQLRGSPVLGSSASFGSGPGVETVAPMPSVAPHSALGATGSSLTPLGPTAMNMVGSVGIPPSAAQPAGTTNPFLL